jgi:hypothetical protein
MHKENQRMKKRSLGSVLRAAALASVVLLGACVGDGDELLAPVNTTPNGGTLFLRYVSMGNSITAGYQSSGINDSTQQRAYPVLLAQRAGTPVFEIPRIAMPGCPRPFAAPLGATGRVGTEDSCTRINNPRIVHNVAVPGARIRDVIQFPTGQLALLHTLLVGERTQARAMIEADPTFVSAWIGNNDALEAAVGGILGPRAAGADSSLTPLATFQGRLNALVDSIKAAGPEGVMLVGVVNAIQGAPIIQPGAYFFIAAQATGGSFQGKPVNPNCSPITALGQPNPLSANFVSFQILGDANFLEINCDPNAYGAADPRRGAYLLDTQEQVIVSQRVAQFNNAIEAAANANGWVYVDPNLILLPFLQEETTVTIGGTPFQLHQRLRKCQDLPGATTLAALQAAVVTSCPVTGPTAAPNFFGSLMSFDGVHPSTEGHRVLAGRFASRINTKYNTNLSTAIN